MLVEIQRLVPPGRGLFLPRARDHAGAAVGLDGDEGARAQVEGAGEATHQGEHDLVRPEAGAALAHQALERAAHRSLPRRATGVLPVPDPGVKSGAELGQVDRRRERVVGAERERRRGGVGVGPRDDYDDRRRSGAWVAQDGAQRIGRRAGEGDQDGVGFRPIARRPRLDQLESRPGQGALEPRGPGRGIAGEQHAAAVRHAREIVKCISAESPTCSAPTFRPREACTTRSRAGKPSVPRRSRCSPRPPTSGESLRSRKSPGRRSGASVIGVRSHV